jgi:S-(hydroxymethyl)glutathione dehydrogenase/alcohol dehydrogenase
MIDSMKAAVLVSPGQPLKILDNIRIPEPKTGQVLVKLAYSGVCHSQLMEAKGFRGNDPYLPHLLGHEGSGQVIMTGAGVKKVKIGDKVILGWIKGSGLEGGGVQYSREPDYSVINAGSVTTFNEYAVVSENRIARLPDGVPLDIAVLLGCAIPTGAGIISNEIKPDKGSCIAIFGLGGIGMNSLIATNLYECSCVIAVDISTSKLELAKTFGATHIINAMDTDPVAVIHQITNNKGVDYAVEASGNVKVIEQAFASVRKNGGVCIFASHPPHGDKICIDPYELICGKHIRGTWGGSSNLERDIPIYANLYKEGKLPLEKLLTKRYQLEEINAALKDLEEGKVGRPIIEINNFLC